MSDSQKSQRKKLVGKKLDVVKFHFEIPWWQALRDIISVPLISLHSQPIDWDVNLWNKPTNERKIKEGMVTWADGNDPVGWREFSA